MHLKQIGQKIWRAIRIYVIIALGIIIGVSFTISYQEYGKLRSDYSESMIIINKHFEKKSAEEVKADSEAKPEGEGETQSLSPTKEIEKYFPEEPKVAIAIFRTESGLRYNAQNWNCHYYENGKKVSRSCQPEDRGKAWSVDCGIAQINVRGKVCPSHLFDIKENLKVARAKYEKSGWNPWVVYKTGAYKNKLER